VLPPVIVTVTETSTLNVQMILGEARETVEVSATVQAVQSENATLGTVVDSRTIGDLPLSTRNYTQILTMSTGVVADVSKRRESRQWNAGFLRQRSQQHQQ